MIFELLTFRKLTDLPVKQNDYKNTVNRYCKSSLLHVVNLKTQELNFWHFDFYPCVNYSCKCTHESLTCGTAEVNYRHHFAVYKNNTTYPKLFPQGRSVALHTALLFFSVPVWSHLDFHSAGSSKIWTDLGCQRFCACVTLA